MRIIFAGTPEVAVPSLRALVESDHEVVAVLTRAPAPVGRKRIVTPSPVHAYADELGIPVYTPARVSEIAQEIAALEADVVAVVAYGLLIPESALTLTTHGWINLHFSLLPRWRGAAPVQHAVWAGDSVTGACTFQIEKGLDTGPVFRSLETPVGTKTSADLLGELQESGARLLVETMDDVAAGRAVGIPQEGEVTLAPRLFAVQGEIDWSAPTAQIAAHIRAFTPAPGAWTTLDGERFKVGAAPGDAASYVPPQPDGLPADAVPGTVAEGYVRTGDGWYELETVAPPGKRWMNARDWMRGVHGSVVLGEAHV